MSNRVNLSPLHWGPKGWFFLESIAIAYPTNPTEEEKTSAKNLLLSLRDLLPCLNCRLNYTSYLGELIDGNYLDEIVKDRDSLTTFMINVHNDVRVRNDQSTRSIEDVFNYYQVQYSKKVEREVENFQNTNNKILSKDEIINNMNMNKKEHDAFTNISSEILFHFNPITLIIGFMFGLIIYKFYQDSTSSE
jgi:hypothetical protein